MSLKYRLVFCTKCEDDTEHTYRVLRGTFPLHDRYTCQVCGREVDLLHRTAEDFRATGYLGKL